MTSNYNNVVKQASGQFTCTPIQTWNSSCQACNRPRSNFASSYSVLNQTNQDDSVPANSLRSNPLKDNTTYKFSKTELSLSDGIEKGINSSFEGYCFKHLTGVKFGSSTEL